MFRLGVEKYNPNYTTHCKDLIEAKLIGEINAKNYDLGHIYYLTRKGALNISEHSDELLKEVNYVKSSPHLQPSTMHHRVMSIGCQIELDISAKNADYTVPFYVRDIERSTKKGKLSKATRMHVKDFILEPDAVFQVNDRLFCYEYENQTHTGRSLEKIWKHCDAIDTRSVGKNWELNSGSVPALHRVLLVYEDEKVMRNVMSRFCKEAIEKYRSGNWFLFKHLSEVLPDIKISNNKFHCSNAKIYFTDWLNCHGETVNMLE